MPVTKTAKRALRSSKRKETVNRKTVKELEIALRNAEKSRSEKAVREAVSKTHRAAKKGIIHSNKAARIVNRLYSSISPKGKKN